MVFIQLETEQGSESRRENDEGGGGVQVAEVEKAGSGTNRENFQLWICVMFCNKNSEKKKRY